MVSSHAIVFSSTILFACLAKAFDYTIGVGIDETTGRPGIGFDPSSTHPTTGDTLVFEFHEGQHQVIECTFEDPCTPKQGGFSTTVQTVAAGSVGSSFSVAVNNTDPLWFFDAFGTLCMQGAVFSVNPDATGDQTAGAFRARAIALGAGMGLTTTTTTTTSTTSLTTTASSSSVATTSGSSSSSASTTASGASQTGTSNSGALGSLEMNGLGVKGVLGAGTVITAAIAFWGAIVL